MEPQLFHVVYIDDVKDSERLLSVDKGSKEFFSEAMVLAELLCHLQIPLLFLSNLRLVKKTSLRAWIRPRLDLNLQSFLLMHGASPFHTSVSHCRSFYIWLNMSNKHG